MNYPYNITKTDNILEYFRQENKRDRANRLARLKRVKPTYTQKELEYISKVTAEAFESYFINPLRWSNFKAEPYANNTCDTTSC